MLIDLDPPPSPLPPHRYLTGWDSQVEAPVMVPAPPVILDSAGVGGGRSAAMEAEEREEGAGAVMWAVMLWSAALGWGLGWLLQR